MACNGAGANPPASLAEFTLGGYQGRVLLVDGFNLPISITPERGFGDCISEACPLDVIANCPPELGN